MHLAGRPINWLASRGARSGTSWRDVDGVWPVKIVRQFVSACLGVANGAIVRTSGNETNQ